MKRVIRAYVPQIHKLALESRQASEYLNGSSTYLQKKAFLFDRAGVNKALVSECVKMGSAVLKSLKTTKAQEKLLLDNKTDEEKLESREEEEEGLETLAAINPLKALGIGTALAAPAAVAANYTLNKASDDLDHKLWAIPGLAAATVGAILAARDYSGSTSPIGSEQTEELESALNAKDVIDSIDPDSSLASSDDLAKLSALNVDHIANILTDILL